MAKQTRDSGRLFPEPPPEPSRYLDVPAEKRLGVDTGGTQSAFDFLKPPPPAELSVTEAQSLLDDLLREARVLEHLHGSDIEVRAKQFPVIKQVLQLKDNILLNCGTGVGKTIISFIKSVHAMHWGQRVIFAAPTKNLAEQAAGVFERLLAPGHFHIALMTDKQKYQRERIIEGAPDVLCATEHSLFNDRHNDSLWHGVGLIIFDEPQSMKRTVIIDGKPELRMVPVTPYITQHLPSNVQQLYLSATPGRDRGDLKLLTSEAGSLTKIFVPDDTNAQDFHHDSIEDIYPVSLDPQLYEISSHLREVALGKYNEARELCKDVPLFEVPADYPLSIPSYEQIKNLTDAAKRSGNTLAMMHAYHCDTYVRFFKDVTFLGRFVAFEQYAYRYMQKNIDKKLVLDEIGSELKPAHEQLLKDKKLRLLMRHAMQDTPYEAIFDAQSIDDVLDLADQMFRSLVGAESDEYSYNKERAKAFSKRMKKLAKGDVKKSYAARYFEQSLHYMARKKEPDHRKIIALGEKLNIHSDLLTKKVVVVGTYSVRHADFLTLTINHRFGLEGVRAEVLRGRMDKGARQPAKQRLDSLESNVAVVTNDFGAQGTDFPNVGMAFLVGLNKASATQIHQFIGRVKGRTGDDPYYFFAFGTKGASEIQWVETAEERFSEQQKKLGHRGIGVVPEFTLSKDPPTT